MPMSCRNQGCPGEYEEERITKASRFPDGRIIVIEDIPALVCDFCGDTLIGSEAAEELERIKAGKAPAIGSVPLYRYGTAAALVPAGASDQAAGDTSA
jgi:YgiT-type zinc finger domain-containing protein